MSEKSINLYYSEASKTALLSRKEECKLAKQVQTASPRTRKKAREKLILANLRLVIKVAQRYKHYGLEIQDLISEGNIGLMKAVERFNPKKKVKFSTYACWWIKQGIRRALSNKSRLIRIPVHMTQIRSQIFKYINEYKIQNSGGEPTSKQIGKHFKIKKSKIEEILELDLLHSPTSLDASLGEEGETEKIEVIEDKSVTSPSKETEINNEYTMLRQVMDAVLSDREKYIVEHRFGMGRLDAETLEKIGKKFKITRERVRQIEAIAFRKLRLGVSKRNRIWLDK